MGEQLREVDSAEAIVEQAIRGAGLRLPKLEQAQDVSRFALIALVDGVANITGPLPRVFRNCAALAASDTTVLLSEAIRLMGQYRLSQPERLTLSVELAKVLPYMPSTGDLDLQRLEVLTDKLPLLSLALAASAELPAEILAALAGLVPNGSTAQLQAPAQFSQHTQMFLNRSRNDRTQLIDALRLVPGLLCSADELLASTLALLNLPDDDDVMMRFGHFTKELRIGELSDYPAFAQELIRGYLPIRRASANLEGGVVSVPRCRSRSGGHPWVARLRSER